MDLSIIILNWNTPKATVNCIKSILKYLPTNSQKKDPQRCMKHEIIVADNASTDNSIKLFKKFKKNFGSPTGGCDLEFVFLLKNHGFSKGNNLASKKAKGDYLLFLNSDMKLIDNSIVNMLSFLQKNPKIGAIGPQFLNPNKSPQASVFPKQSILNAFKQFWFKQPNKFTKYIPKNTSPSSVYAISGGAFLISKKLFNRVGKWNEKYFMYFEDLDLCRRIHQTTKQLYYYPQSKVIHYHGLSGKNLVNSKNQWKRLIPSSKIYHGLLKHYLLTLIIWLSLKCQKK
ncbi:glycosyltransferase [Patescibacteria group bacterium]|nr:glycosyltransferase [Patescibacteria group bacterium]